MKRARSESRNKADTAILAQIIMLKGDHPLWGYRRVWATIRYRQNIVIGKNPRLSAHERKSLANHEKEPTTC